jgi:hypothetical protein
MSYQKSTIKNIIKDIDQNKIYLPALQRKFVWGKQQIQLLFDSLMRNYPFGTFLFWRLHRQKAESYVFYEFLKEYDQRSPYNRRKTGAFLHEEIIGVLDGQQRLSSIYIGLMGTHTERLKYAWANKSASYEKTSLYLNLLSLPYAIDSDDRLGQIEDQNFEFRFLTEAKAQASISRKVDPKNGEPPREEAMFWMKVGQVLFWDDDPEFDQIIDAMQKQCASDIQRDALSKQKRMIKRGLDTLHRRIFQDELINYFEVVKDDLEDILKIFVRVNSGGTVLSKPDLLFSTIVATWDNGREQIETLIKKINAKGDGFSFSNEYLMRCCLILSDGPAVYKVNSFKSENVENIRKAWPQIAAAVEKTVDLLVDYGFNGATLSSQASTIILSYYIYKGGDLSERSKIGMRKFLIHALLKGIYSSSLDQLLTVLRNAFREECNPNSGLATYKGRFKSFSFEEVLKIPLPQQKSLAVTSGDIDRFLMHKKGTGAFLVLSLLYPQLRIQEVKFHQDHIHPEAGFSDDNFRKMGIPADQWQLWREYRDCVPNLQLLEGKRNESKNKTPFKVWFEKMDQSGREHFARNNFLPEEIGYEFENFKDFFEKRREKLRTELKRVLAFTGEASPDLQPDWGDRNDELDAPALEIEEIETE